MRSFDILLNDAFFENDTRNLTMHYSLALNLTRKMQTLQNMLTSSFK